MGMRAQDKGQWRHSVFTGVAGCTRLWSVLEPESKVLVTVNPVMPSLLAPSWTRLSLATDPKRQGALEGQRSLWMSLK